MPSSARKKKGREVRLERVDTGGGERRDAEQAGDEAPRPSTDFPHGVIPPFRGAEGAHRAGGPAERGLRKRLVGPRSRPNVAADMPVRDRFLSSRNEAESFGFASSQGVSFFFYWYGDPRDLHSFPTRRSSDLGSPSGSGPPWPCTGSEGGPRRPPRSSASTCRA